uniref:asparagine synthase (glutamine-hydrolyzing) n=1 Tax=Haptolina brevifila TaxID=156173 RepID=A0A7S2E451_9EUKA
MPALRPALAVSRAARSADVSMCGILAVYKSKMSPSKLRLQTLTLQRLVRHRGPDGSGIHVISSEDETHSSLAHERLAIVDPLSGNQPLFSHDRKRSLAVNGEIYNHKQLRTELADQTPFRTESDCEVIVHLYDEVGVDVASKLDGDFAFCILDETTGELYAARDPIGVNSLYMGTGLDGSTWFSSEAKPLVAAGCLDVSVFPPGCYWTSKTGELVEYYKPDWRDVSAAVTPLDLQLVRDTFTRAVEKRLMTDVPYGVLLSGGLDSSLVASVVTRLQRKRFLEFGNPADLQPLKSYSIGLEGSPDLENAQKVAESIGTEHYGFTFTVQEGIDAVSDVIYHLETYDITTIRAGTPMFLLARKIKAMGVKMVLSGEGADETLAGYLYFHKAPDSTELHEECVRKVGDLHKYDCLRANKATMAHGLEARVPFLDKDMLDVTMRTDPEYKMYRKGAETQFIEKWLLRAAFDTPEQPYLPSSVLWRQKEQFSDGVGYSWIDGIKEHADKVVSDEDMATAAIRFAYNTPSTKEGAYYRTIFHSHFPNNNYGNGIEETVPGGPSIACSTAKAIEWDEAWSDPSRQDQSGRMVDTHDSSL